MPRTQTALSKQDYSERAGNVFSRYRFYDVGVPFLIYVAVAVLCGAVRPFPFDDETSTLRNADFQNLSHSVRSLIQSQLDVHHPPLSYLIFGYAQQLGLSVAGMRSISIVATALALALWYGLILPFTESIGKSRRLLISLLFATTPLALGVGGAVRWYPIFAVLVALACFIYLRFGSNWFLSAIPLGFAADTEYLAALPLAAIFLHRYVMERRFEPRQDLPFLAIGGLVAVPGFAALFHVLQGDFGFFRDQITTFGVPRALLKTLLGFFGGDVLGLSQGWIVLLAAASAVYLSGCVWRHRREDPDLERLCELVMLTAGLAVVLVAFSFDKAYAFLFLAPMVSAMAGAGLAKSTAVRSQVALCACSVILVTGIAVAGNLQHNRHPFKRQVMVPFDEVIDFVHANESGKTAVLTSDVTVDFLLAGERQLCVMRFEVWDSQWETSQCALAAHLDTILVIKGDPLDEETPQWKKMLTRCCRERPDRRGGFRNRRRCRT